MKTKYQIGQWVRFYNMGTLVIGVVQYVRYDSTFDRCPRYQTDIGEVPEDRIVEARSQSTSSWRTFDDPPDSWRLVAWCYGENAYASGYYSPPTKQWKRYDGNTQYLAKWWCDFPTPPETTNK